MTQTTDTPGPDQKPAPKKSDKATVAQRVEEILRIRLDGAQFHDIVQYGSEKGWNVSERMIGKYIAKADALLVERLDKKRKPLIARHIAQREALYARCINAADFRTALAILADLARLRGLYPEKEIKELQRLATAQGLRLEELERRLRAAGLSAQTTLDGGCSPPISLEEAKRIAREAAAEAMAAYREPPTLPGEPPPDPTEATSIPDQLSSGSNPSEAEVEETASRV